jgi:hypothetical protein
MVTNLSLGVHTLAVAGQDNAGNRATNSVTVTLVTPLTPQFTLGMTGGGPQLQWNAPGFVLQHALQIAGPWSSLLPQPASPYALSVTNAQEYFRLSWPGP